MGKILFQNLKWSAGLNFLVYTEMHRKANNKCEPMRRVIQEFINN